MAMESGVQSASVVGLTWYTADLFELVLERPDFCFTPGDNVSLFAADQDQTRPYSIASGVHEPVLRFLIRKMTGGVVTSFLAALQPGDRVRMSRPFGWFHPGQGGGEPFFFVATGTGIAPFLSALRSDPARAPLRCLYGVRYRAEAVGLSVLDKHVPVELAVSRQQVAGTYHGRVTGLLDRLPPAPQAHFYLCGLDTMIASVGAWLEARGLDPFHIHREVFYHAPYKQTGLSLDAGR